MAFHFFAVGLPFPNQQIIRLSSSLDSLDPNLLFLTTKSSGIIARGLTKKDSLADDA
jgi:hypothetical protein